MRRALAAGSALEYAASDDAIIIGYWNTWTSKWTVLNALFITEKAKSPANWAGLFDDFWLPDLGSNQGPTD